MYSSAGSPQDYPSFLIRVCLHTASERHHRVPGRCCIFLSSHLVLLWTHKLLMLLAATGTIIPCSLVALVNCTFHPCRLHTDAAALERGISRKKII